MFLIFLQSQINRNFSLQFLNDFYHYENYSFNFVKNFILESEDSLISPIEFNNTQEETIKLVNSNFKSI